MTREEAIKRFNGIIHSMSISVAQAKFYPTKAELNELCDMAIEALSTDLVRCKDCRHKVVTKDGEYNQDDIVCDYWLSDGLDSNDFCSYGERKEE